MALKIFLFGKFEVYRDDQLISPKEWRPEKTKTLFQILLTDPGRKFSKDELIEWLWPDNTDTGEQNLKTTVSYLRKILEADLAKGTDSSFIKTASGKYYFHKDECFIDTDQFKSLYREGLKCEREKQIEKAIELFQKSAELYRGEFLIEENHEDWALEDVWQFIGKGSYQAIRIEVPIKFTAGGILNLSYHLYFQYWLDFLPTTFSKRHDVGVQDKIIVDVSGGQQQQVGFLSKDVNLISTYRTQSWDNIKGNCAIAPLAPSNRQSAKSTLWWYDSSQGDYVGISTTEPLNPSRAYFISIEDDCKLQLDKNPDSTMPSEIQFANGWNMFSVSKDTTWKGIKGSCRSDILDENKDESILTFDRTHKYRRLRESEPLYPYYGYLVRVAADCKIDLSKSSTMALDQIKSQKDSEVATFFEFAVNQLEGLTNIIPPLPDPILVPKAPSKPQAIIRSGEVRLTWQDNANNETGYLVERRELDTEFYYVSGELPANTKSYLDRVMGNYNYCYRVVAFNGYGASLPSEVACVTVKSDFLIYFYSDSINKGAVNFLAVGSNIEKVQIRIFDLRGREIFNEDANGKRLNWPGRDKYGVRIANGTYVWMATINIKGGRVQTVVQKLTVLR